MRLRVLSYNIHRAIGVDRRFRPERVAEIIEYYNPDVAMLQEVDEGAPRSRELDLARELARALGFEHYAIGHNVRLRKGRYGNATLSRWPIRARAQHRPHDRLLRSGAAASTRGSRSSTPAGAPRAARGLQPAPRPLGPRARAPGLAALPLARVRRAAVRGGRRWWRAT